MYLFMYVSTSIRHLSGVPVTPGSPGGRPGGPSNLSGAGRSGWGRR